MIEIRDYSLPDRELIEDKTSVLRVLVWQPPYTCVVLGFGNDPATALQPRAVERDGLLIMKRPSGGEAVLLTPNMLAVSLLQPTAGIVSPFPLFRAVGRRLIAALESQEISGLTAEGISDIARAGRKVYGAAIYQRSGRMLYHGILNVAEPATTFGRYLRQPRRQPPWRACRSHADFITSLQADGLSDDSELTRLQQAISAALQNLN